MKTQSKQEEWFNAVSHGFGAFLGLIGLFLLVLKVKQETPYALASVLIYGVSIVILFSASTIYHSVTNHDLKLKFRILDHISIYLLIAGTYTPVLLILLTDSLGWPLFWAVWGITAFGIIMKIFFTGKFEILSTALYLVMGWLIILDFDSLSYLLHTNGLYLLYAGGVFYTVGIIFYVVHQIPYNHVIWHFFVLFGALSHFLMVYFYVV